MSGNGYLHSENLPSQIHYSEFGHISWCYKLFIKGSKIEEQSRNCKKIERKKNKQ